MPSIINSDNGAVSGSAGLKFDSADDGILHIQNSGNTAIAIANTGQATFTHALSQPGSFMFRNKIINGNFDIWQRGANQTSSSYGSADRWYMQHSGSTKTASRQAFDLGQTDVPNNPKYFMRHVVTSVAGASSYVMSHQRVEGVETLSGKTATLSFWAKADSSKNITVEFRQYFGTGGSPDSHVNAIGAQLVALTTSWAKYTVTVDLPSVSGKTLGTDGNDFLGIYFWFDAGSDFNDRTANLGQQSGTFDIAQVQLEEGSAATPFEQRPLTMEQQLCYRYYVDLLQVSGAGYASAANQTERSVGSISFPVSMRTASPTITYTHSTGTNLSGSWSVINGTNNLGCSMIYPAGAAGSTYWRGRISVEDEL